ncbi:hypothetical protein [Methanolapillus africanus]|uniref:hypothetical protein n=1 Tax=Methanolapillus africanus TaxID=3028297 RepID=UPI0030B8BA45
MGTAGAIYTVNCAVYLTDGIPQNTDAKRLILRDGLHGKLEQAKPRFMRPKGAVREANLWKLGYTVPEKCLAKRRNFYAKRLILRDGLLDSKSKMTDNF